MANTASAQKRVRSNERKRVRNQKTRTRARTAIRTAREALAGANVNADASRKAALAAISELDKAAEKGVIHKNNAARRKSRLMKKLAALETKK